MTASAPERSSVVVEVRVDSLEVSKILHSDRYPTTPFRSTRVSGVPGSLKIDGDLTVMDRTEPITVRAVVGEDGRVTGSATVTQTRWGIRPYSAFPGALKLADDVTIELDGVLAPAQP